MLMLILILNTKSNNTYNNIVNYIYYDPICLWLKSANPIIGYSQRYGCIARALLYRLRLGMFRTNTILDNRQINCSDRDMNIYKIIIKNNNINNNKNNAHRHTPCFCNSR